MDRPFVYGGLAQKENFIDRTEDKRKLKTFLSNGVNVMLISPRRWGKSSLVKAAMEELCKEDDKVRVCFMDAFTVNTLAGFYDSYATSVIKGIGSGWDKVAGYLRKFLPSLSPSIRLGEDPVNSVSLGLNLKDTKSEEEVLNLPEKIAAGKGWHVIICIDEFQQLAELPEWKELEGKLRSVWQQQENVTYCLYGSQRHMMSEIFNNSSNPFYRFGQVLYLGKIPKEYWIPYITGSFEKTGKKISEKVAGEICDAVKCHSWYVQQLSFFVWADTKDVADEAVFRRQLQTLIDTNAPLFEAVTGRLAASQISMLKAIASGETKLSSRNVVERYRLGAPQTISKNKRMLVNLDIVEKGPGGFSFVDPTFELWFRQKFLDV